MLVEAAMHIRDEQTLLTSTMNLTLTLQTNFIIMAFFFLDLPREIRDQIYIHILAPTGLFTITRSSSGRYIRTSYPGSNEISFDLFRACKQIKAEAEDTF